METSSSTNNGVRFHGERCGSKGIVQPTNRLFNRSTVATAHVKGDQPGLLAKPKAQTFTAPVKAFACFNLKAGEGAQH